ANTSMRDLTGLCLFDETAVKLMRPARTARHLAELMNELADAAGLPPSRGTADIEGLMRLGVAFAEETYPQLMDESVNRTPWWLARGWPSWRHRSMQRSWGGWASLILAWTFAVAVFFFVALVEGFTLDVVQSVLVPLLNEVLG